jgi:hypothetical protein
MRHLPKILLLVASLASLLVGALLTLADSQINEQPAPSGVQPDATHAGSASAADAAPVRKLAGQRSLTVLCSFDRNPIAEALVTTESRTASRSGLTDAEGRVELDQETWDSVEACVDAPGFRPWKGAPSRVTEGRVLLEGLAGFALTAESGAFPPGTTATARALRIAKPSDEERLATGTLESDGRIWIRGLRPRHAYTIEVSAPGHTLFVASPATADWPTLRILPVAVGAREAHGIEVHGIEEVDCTHLTVTLGSGNRVSRPSPVQWDPALLAGFATPESPGLQEGEARLIGPFGITLARRPWKAADGQTSRIDAALQKSLVSMVAPTGMRLPGTEPLLWRGTDSSGIEAPTAPGLLAVYSSREHQGQEVFLQWGRLVAPSVRMPRVDPIRFMREHRGELRVTGAGSSTVEARSQDTGERTMLKHAVGATQQASLTAGSYVLMIDGTATEDSVRVLAGEVTAVSLSQLREKASVEILLPESLGTIGTEVLVDLCTRQRADKVLRSLAIPSSRRSTLASGMPPGELIVHAKAGELGYSRATCILRSGHRNQVVLENWSRERQLMIHMTHGDGHPAADVEIELNLQPSGQTPITRGKTDAMGTYVWQVVGHGRLTIGGRQGTWTVDLAPDQTRLDLDTGLQHASSLAVHCTGWWQDKVRGVGTVSANPTVRFLPGIESDGFYRVPRLPQSVLVLRLSDKRMLFTSVDAHASELRLDAPLPTTEIHASLEDESEDDRPTSMMVRVLEIDGIRIADSVLASSQRRPQPFDEPFALQHGASLRIVIDGMGSHGGIAWRSDELLLRPGMASITVPLRRMTR